MFVFALLLAIASAAPYPDPAASPAITSSASLSIATPSCNTVSQFCERSGQPFFNTANVYESSLQPWNNPYAQGFGETAYVNSSVCAAAYFSQMTAYLSSAPITILKDVEAETTTETQTATTEVVTSSSGYYASSSTVIYTDYVDPSLTTGSVAYTTWEQVNSIGVWITTIESFIIVTGQTWTQPELGYTTTLITSTIPGFTSTVTSGGYPIATYASNFTYTAEQPCCSTCTLYGTDVEVFYWPTATTTSAPTASPTPGGNYSIVANSSLVTHVNSAGFTFTSPSVYVGYKSLYATDMCKTVGVVAATTIAYNPGELSTDNYYKWNTADYLARQPSIAPIYSIGTWGTEDCADGGKYTTTTFWQYPWPGGVAITRYPTSDSDTGGTILGIVYTDPPQLQYTVSYNPCLPLIGVPTNVFSLNTAFATCVQGVAGLQDPPSAISSATLGVAPTLVATSTTPVVATPTSTVQPQSTAVAPTPTPTTAVVIPVPTTSSSPPAVVQDPGTSTYADPGTSTSANVDPAPVTPTPSPSTSSIAPAITLGSSTITENSASVYVIGTQTLAPGSQITQSGTTISLNSIGTAVVVIAGSTTATQVLLPAASSSSPPAVIAIGSSIITQNSASAYVIGTQTLVPGSAIVQSGTTISLNSAGTAVVVINNAGTSTQIPAAKSSPAVITINNSPITGNPTSAFVIASQTLTPGGKITVSNTIISLDAGGTTLLLIAASGTKTSTSTELIKPTTPSKSSTASALTKASSPSPSKASSSSTVAGVGGAVNSIGGYSTPSPKPVGPVGNGTVFVNGGRKSRGRVRWVVYGVVGLVGFWAGVL